MDARLIGAGGAWFPASVRVSKVGPDVTGRANEREVAHPVSDMARSALAAFPWVIEHST